jgi:ketosteroid isomerase-like protein
MRDAFLEFLAEDSILFRPGPVAGRKWMSDQPSRPGVLAWQPIFAEVAAGGDLGYTTGPWEFRQDRSDEQPAGHGHFISVWQKQADGQWKVALDTGIGCPPPQQPFAEWQPAPDGRAPGDQPAVQIDMAVARGALLDVDRALSQASAQAGPGRAFSSHITHAARFYRAGMYPLLGRQAIEGGLPERGKSLTWQPVSGGIARTGDLGYTYGTFELRAIGPDGESVEPGAYLRVWKKPTNGAWRIVVDVANPFPPPAPAT